MAIKKFTNSKSWTTTLSACNVTPRDGFTDPKDATELRAICGWLAAADAIRMTDRIKSFSK